MANKIFPVSSTQIVFNGPTVLKGLVLTDFAGAIASIEVYDGLSDQTKLILSVSVIANGSNELGLGSGVDINNGLYVKVIAGTPKISFYIQSELNQAST